MLPIYDPIILEKKDLPGGSTRPILIYAKYGENIEKFVVKLFTSKHNAQYSPIANECYCHFLAKQFDLQTPDIVLIRFSNEFVKNLDPDIQSRIDLRESDLFFGSKYHDGYVQYIPDEHYRTFQNWDIETIFSFDVLVRNTDRRNGKPNLLVNNANYLVIDHELCLSISKNFEDMCANQEWDFLNGFGDKGRVHIFKERISKNIEEFDFAQITEYVRGINIHEIGRVAEFLHYNGVNPGNVQALNSYLSDVKIHNAQFVNLCKRLIS